MIKYNIENNLPKTLYNNNSSWYLIKGWVFGEAEISELFVTINTFKFNSKEFKIFRPDVAIYNSFHKNSFFSGFTIPVVIDNSFEEGTYEVMLTAKFKNGDILQEKLNNVVVKPFKSQTDIAFPKKSDVVICMATYNPSKNRFLNQIESIKAQTYKDWICIICDDGSQPNKVDEIKSIIEDDNRFVFVENKNNLGFYHNFERCLSLVPEFAKYVVLADQDDYWYPYKIEKCLSKIKTGAQLVYSDMKIVKENQEVVHDTYWVNRKNYYNSENVDLLTIANTVTGAASIFRADLLKDILPFPQKNGAVFHDQWIAIIAAIKGKIEYIDEPLYDYIQGNDNVIGHTDFVKTSFLKKLKAYFSKNVRAENLKYIYFFKHKNGEHIVTLAENANVRINEETKQKNILQRTLSVNGLLKTSFKVYKEKHTLNDLDLILMSSYISNKVVNRFSNQLSSLLVKRYKNKQQQGVLTTNNSSSVTIDPAILEYKRKFSGRKFNVNNDKKRFNVLISGIDSKNFFGGYIGMFNFAKIIYELGNNVRILVTDQKEISADEVKKIQNHDESIRDFLSNVEIEACFSYKDEISISPDDVFVATSWWTAHIANEAKKLTKKRKFIYLSQDYEPIFYEHGGYRVLAEESYKLDYVPLFSTDILQRYFIENNLVTDKGEYFNNPILDFQLTKNSIEVKRKKKLLFYARPQPHNARNLYPIGLLAINKAVEKGYFSEEEWEIIGIGGDVGVQYLPSGAKINHIGKFDMKKYKEVLPQHDLGLSLMDSPHPSLLPIEMASAGMLVVTNTYGIKDQNYFSHISSNILATEPYIECLADALIKQLQKINEVGKRYEGSKINWPTNWEEALNKDKVKRIISKVDI